jgi:N-methylhydantoinase B
VGGYDPFRNREFTYYETIAGGAGGGPHRAGASAVHTHMTNTLNTPVEALESGYPLRVTRYRLRTRSGGKGRHPGGDGVVREIELLAPARVTLLTERRRTLPYGLAGGSHGQPGRNLLSRGARTRMLPGKAGLAALAGDGIRVLTPGGGGWGRHR